MHADGRGESCVDGLVGTLQGRGGAHVGNIEAPLTNRRKLSQRERGRKSAHVGKMGNG
jgi:hypothetical protein